ERDVDVALRVLDDLGRFRHPDAAHAARAGGHDGSVQPIDELRRFGRRTRGDLEDVRQAMLLVAGIDALRTVTDKESLVELQPGFTFQYRHADLFGAPGVDGRFVHDHATWLQRPAHYRAGVNQRRKVRSLVLVDGRR